MKRLRFVMIGGFLGAGKTTAMSRLARHYLALGRRIGLAVAVLIAVIAPLTQACFNPARDFGPRLVAAVAGWGWAAFPRGTGFLTVYILSPTVGAVLGGGLYTRVLRPLLPAKGADVAISMEKQP